MVQRYVTGSTAIVVAVPQAERAVVDVRARYDPAAGYGVPAHVTVLFPWLPVGSIGEADLDGLRVLAAATPAFDAELVTVGRFPKVAWLAPAPSEAFAAPDPDGVDALAAVPSLWGHLRRAGPAPDDRRRAAGPGARCGVGHGRAAAADRVQRRRTDRAGFRRRPVAPGGAVPARIRS